MPIYEYECQTCGEEFEVIQKFSDPPLKKHTCAPRSVVIRKISLNAFQLKGGGWYNEGYAKGNGKSGNGADGGAKDKSDSAAGKGAGTSTKAGDGGGAKSESSGSSAAKSESSGSSAGKESSKSAGSSPAST